MTKVLRQKHLRGNQKNAKYLIANQAKNKPDCRRWMTFVRGVGDDSALVIYVFDLDLNPNSYLAVTSITTGLAALFTLRPGGAIDFTSMNETDLAGWAKTGILPKSYYG